MNPINVKIRIPYDKGTALGPGKVDLLEAIETTGSISAAAKSMKMSYKRAWDLVNTMNQSFKQPLIITITGGKQGGGASVTSFGLSILKTYREMERQANESIIELSKQITNQLNTSNSG
jgi:molybdate transport system regulatory protein